MSTLGLDALVLFKRRKMVIFFVFAMLLGAALQITNTFGEAFLHDFGEIYPDSFAVKHPGLLMSVSQMSETLFILTIPFFLIRFGIKRVMLMSIFAWFFRFALFGIGNPGGTVGVQSNRALFKGNFGEADFSYDSLSGKRTSIDQKLVLVKDRVALRGDFLLERKDLFRTPTAQNKEGAFLTTTIHPFKNDRNTSVILSYEAGTRDDISARPFAPFDGFSTWIANGAPLYNNLTAAAPPGVVELPGEVVSGWGKLGLAASL